MKSIFVSFFVVVVFVFGILLFGTNTSLLAQSSTTLTPQVLPMVPDYRSEWMLASTTEKQKLAEEIGEAGARRFAATKNWEPVLIQSDKAMRQGIDQVYRSGDGLVHAIEAKGGTSPLGHGYGHPQGTPEWAVKSAEAMLKNHAATEVEKKAARLVVEAAAKEKLVVHVIRTPHVLGKPNIPVVESMLKSTPNSVKLACEALHGFVAGNTARCVTTPQATIKANVPSPTLTNAAKATEGVAEGTAIGLGKTVAKAAPVVGVAVEVGLRGYNSYQTEADYAIGKIDPQTRFENHAGNAGGCVGGVGGAYAGATGGAMAGAAVGSVVPIVGTAIGGVVGGVLGGIGGYLIGDTVGDTTGRKAASWLY